MSEIKTKQGSMIEATFAGHLKTLSKTRHHELYELGERVVVCSVESYRHPNGGIFERTPVILRDATPAERRKV